MTMQQNKAQIQSHRISSCIVGSDCAIFDAQGLTGQLNCHGSSKLHECRTAQECYVTKVKVGSLFKMKRFCAMLVNTITDLLTKSPISAMINSIGFSCWDMNRLYSFDLACMSDADKSVVIRPKGITIIRSLYLSLQILGST